MMGRTAISLFIASFLLYTSLVLIHHDSPFVYDEGSYALMILEFSRDPSMVIPTITGEPVEYKPPLFTWVYSSFYLALEGLDIPVEALMRLPSALFGALSAALVFLIAKRLYDRRAAAAAAILFFTSPLMLFASTSVMMEAFSIFLILAAMLSYLEKRYIPGMASLALLVLTKWLYVLAPVLFITLYFIKDEELKKILLSFLSIPAALAMYFSLSFLFGGFGNMLMTMSIDVSRAMPSFDIMVMALFLLFFLYVTFPLSAFFAFFILSSDIWKERHLVAMGALAFLMSLIDLFLWWYAIISLPAMAIFVAKRMDGLGRLLPAMLAVMVILNLAIFQTGVFTDSTDDIREAAQFMKGKDVTFFETEPLTKNWQAINDRFIGTDKSYLLLEQMHPGILFYRFGDRTDYQNLSAIFTFYSQEPGCVDYLVVHGEAEIPDCYELVWENPRFKAYSPAS